MKQVFLILSLISLCLCNQYVPVPSRPHGVSFGDSKKLIIEAFYDLACVDSKERFGYLDTVKAQVGSQFKYVIHMFPLPYHRTALPLAQGFAFLSEVSSDAAYLYAKQMFLIQDSLSETATFDWTWQQVLDEIARLTQEQVYPQYHYDLTKFAQALMPGTEYNLKVRYWWKYGTYRTISGAPIFLANGVIMDGADQFEVQQWLDFINKQNPKVQEM